MHLGRATPTNLVAAGLVVNAAATGGLSGPYDRYFARVVWLVGFVALLSLHYAARAGARSAAMRPA